jgi:hypothetical protein
MVIGNAGEDHRDRVTAYSLEVEAAQVAPHAKPEIAHRCSILS